MMKVHFLMLISTSCGWSLTNHCSSKYETHASRRELIKVLGATGIQGSVLTALSLPLEAFAQDTTIGSTTNGEEYSISPRGVIYKVTKPPNDPTSPTPERAQKVKATYTLYLNGFPEDTPDSVKIDSSKGIFGGEKPFEFLAGVSQVIKGWDLTVMDMRVGEARRLVIPSDLGYGDKGAGRTIPGGSTLYFDLELVDIGSMSKMGEEQYRWLEENPL